MSSRKLFVQNIFFLLMVNLIVKPVWIFAIDLKVQNTVGNYTYGHYAALLNFAMIFQILLDFGLQSYNARLIAQTPGKLKTIFPNIIVTKTLLSVWYLGLLVALGFLFNYQGSSMYFLILIGVAQILNSFVLYLRSNVAGLQQFKADSLLSITDKALMIMICATLLYYNTFAVNFRIEWFIWAQLIAYLLTAILAFIICIRAAKFDWGHLNLRRMMVICRKSLPYALLIFLMAIYIRSDIFMLERLLPNSEESGIYASALRLLDVSNNVTGVLFAGILLPLFSRMLAKRQDVTPIVQAGINLLLPLALTTVAIAFSFGTELMKLQHPDAGVYDGRVFSALMFAFPAYCSSYIFSTVLTANGTIRPQIFVALTGTLISVILNWWIIPRFHALGTASVAAVTHISVAALNIILANYILKLRLSWWWGIQLVTFFILIFLCAYGIHHLEIGLFPSLVLSVLAAGILLFATGLFSIKSIRSFSKLLNK